MQKKTVIITVEIELEYDEDHPKFQEALADYKAVILSEAEAEEMVQYVAACAHRQGWRDMIEGVGYVSKNGQCTDPRLYCGIEIIDDDPAPSFELVDTK